MSGGHEKTARRALVAMDDGNLALARELLREAAYELSKSKSKRKGWRLLMRQYIQAAAELRGEEGRIEGGGDEHGKT